MINFSMQRDTLKRTCIKKLPPVLVFYLKRFGYDWEAGRAIKCDDYFEFPWELDMMPYMADYLNDDETQKKDTLESHLFRLKGIVVHSGQASAGHYYSFIQKYRYDIRIPNDKLSIATCILLYYFYDFPVCIAPMRARLP